MTVLAIALHKGGTGKTATTLALGVELARLGRRVLLVDIDPQSNLTLASGYETEEIGASIYEALLQPEQGIAQATLETPHGVDLLPATIALAGAEIMLTGRIGRELLLRRAIEAVRRAYDYVLIDTPPSLGLFTINALVAADSVIVPLQSEALAWRALPQLEETIKLVQQLNPALHISGIVVTMYKRTALSHAIDVEARERYGDLVFAAQIPDTVKLAESPAAGQPISTYAPDSPATKAYRDLAQEVDTRYGSK
jgi:chromosome partitioning protein